MDAVQQAIAQDRAIRRQRAETAHLSACYESLSAREREVLGLVVRGLPNKEIASELGIADSLLLDAVLRTERTLAYAGYTKV